MATDVLLLILSVIAGYLLGSANSALIVGKFHGMDVRRHGSGNAGMTNALRTLGKGAALIVSAGDVLKGILSCLIGLWLADGIGVMSAGLAAIIGHNWPLYFKFKGGKGALTSVAVVFFMDWRIGLMILGIFIITVAVSGYVSLGSMLGAFSFPLFGLISGKDAVFIVFAAAVGLLVIARHRPNIERLLKGTESKIKLKKSVEI